MLISIDHSGQLCNRMLYFVDSLATALDCHENLHLLFAREILGFTDTHPEALPHTKVVLHAWKRPLFVRVLSDLTLRYPYKHSEEKISQWKHSKSIFPRLIWRCGFTNKSGRAKYRDIISKYLKPKPKFFAKPSKRLSMLRKDFSGVILGIHIRRGDYINWRGGAYYFSDEQYLHFMKQFQASTDKPVKFVIVSNDTVDVDLFNQNGCRAINASGCAQEDIVTLSLCDYILGPPSTFSYWAAYLEDKPRFEIRDRNECVEIKKFAKLFADTQHEVKA